MKLTFPDAGVGSVVVVPPGGKPQLVAAAGVVEVPDGVPLTLLVRSDPSGPESPLSWLAGAGLSEHARLHVTAPATTAVIKALAALAPLAGITLTPAEGASPTPLAGRQYSEISLTGADDQWLQWLAAQTALTMLSLDGPEGSAEALAGIDTAMITSLVLRGITATDEMLETLCGPVVEELRISGTSVTSAAAATLSKLEAVRLVELSGGFVNDETLKALASPTLTHAYMVAEPGSVTEAGIEAVAGSGNLVHFALRGSDIQDSGLAALGQCPSLERITVQGPVTDDGLAALSGLGHLQHLDITGGAFGDRGLASLGTLRSLERLDMPGASVTDAGIATLATLGLPLREIRLGSAQVTQPGLFPLFKACPGVSVDGVSLSPKAVDRLLQRTAG